MKPNEKVLELQAINQYMGNLQEHITKLAQNLNELEGVKNSLEELDKIKEEKEGLFSLANGIFVEGKIAKQDTVLMNVGQGVVVRKKLEEATKLIEDQHEELREAMKGADKQFDELVTKAQQLQQQIEAE